MHTKSLDLTSYLKIIIILPMRQPLVSRDDAFLTQSLLQSLLVWLVGLPWKSASPPPISHEEKYPQRRHGFLTRKSILIKRTRSFNSSTWDHVSEPWQMDLVIRIRPDTRRQHATAEIILKIELELLLLMARYYRRKTQTSFSEKTEKRSVCEFAAVHNLS